MPADKKIQRFRRFHGYDYSRGAVLFITFGLLRRQPVFGHVANDKVAYSPVGLAALETLQREMLRNPDLTVQSFVIMPDHVHLRIHIRPGASGPLKAVGQFVNNFKRWSKWKASQLGIDLDWQPNYHDRLCLNAEVIDLVDKYIANNPLKWCLMHGPNPPLKVHEPLDSVRLPDGEWWTGVGNVELLGPLGGLARNQRCACRYRLPRWWRGSLREGAGGLALSPPLQGGAARFSEKPPCRAEKVLVKYSRFDPTGSSFIG